MTDEIKMCKKGRYIEDVISPSGDYVECVRDERWIPLDPQPSCDTCKHSEASEEYRFHTRCDHPLIFMLMPKSFFCKYWKVKE